MVPVDTELVPVLSQAIREKSLKSKLISNNPLFLSTNILLMDQEVLINVTDSGCCTTAVDQICQETEMPLCQNHFMTSSTSVFLSIPPVNYKKRRKCFIIYIPEKTQRCIKCMNECMGQSAGLYCTVFPSVIPPHPPPPRRRLLLLLLVFCFCEGS